MRGALFFFFFFMSSFMVYDVLEWLQWFRINKTSCFFYVVICSFHVLCFLDFIFVFEFCYFCSTPKKHFPNQMVASTAAPPAPSGRVRTVKPLPRSPPGRYSRVYRMTSPLAQFLASSNQHWQSSSAVQAISLHNFCIT